MKEGSENSRENKSGAEHKTANKARRQASRNFTEIWPKTPGRIFGAALIRLYQLTLSGFVGAHCRHMPSCSEYGYEAIARHGLWAGGFLTLFRLIRCGPFGTHGFDPVPRRLPPHYSPFAPWRCRQRPKAPGKTAETSSEAQKQSKNRGKQHNHRAKT